MTGAQEEEGMAYRKDVFEQADRCSAPIPERSRVLHTHAHQNK